MTTNRMEAFSDGVIAILITIMILELKIPHGSDSAALMTVAPHFVAYVLSFIILGIYWNNHHHMLHVTEKVTGAILWANLHLLFWLSLIPATTAWLGENPTKAFPAATYGVVLVGAAISYTVLQNFIISAQGRDAFLADAVGSDRKGKASILLYASAVGLAFVHPFISQAIYAIVAFIWVIPDRRIEGRL
ncbi:MAG TPA: TMEM175 family protein [Longimicrobiales bacterium]|nr:TMEM175 family protein [Longimicrobiales bacterium]